MLLTFEAERYPYPVRQNGGVFSPLPLPREGAGGRVVPGY